MKEQKYVVTAVNNLTGEREAISRPHSRWKTEELLTKARRDHARHRKQAAYSLYRMELWPHEEERLQFQDQQEYANQTRTQTSLPQELERDRAEDTRTGK
jgi:hypothetical protein